MKNGLEIPPSTSVFTFTHLPCGVVMNNQQTKNQIEPVAPAPSEHQIAIDVYWKPSYETLYIVTFQEAVSSALAGRWLRIDALINILVSVTASGSAIAGWALWNQPGWRTVWVLAAGSVSVFAIVHNGAQVPTRLKSQEDFRRQLTRLRTDLETFRQRLEVKIGTLEIFDKNYSELRNRYAELIYNAPSDIANTHRLRVKIQKQIEEVLRDEIQE